MRWDLAAKIDDPDSVEAKIFNGLSELEKKRKAEKAFMSNADMWDD